MTISPLFLFGLDHNDCCVKLTPIPEIRVCFKDSTIGDFLITRHGGKIIQGIHFDIWRVSGKRAAQLLGI